MFPLTIKDLPAEAWDFIEVLGLVPVKLTNDYEPELYWSFESDSDCLRQRIEEENLQYRSWDEMGKVLSLQSLRERADSLFEKSTCISPAVQLSLDFHY